MKVLVDSYDHQRGSLNCSCNGMSISVDPFVTCAVECEEVSVKGPTMIGFTYETEVDPLFHEGVCLPNSFRKIDS